MDMTDFLLWEASTHDTLDLKRVYVDMVGNDFQTAMLLSELIYWHLPAKNGTSRLRVMKDNQMWVAVRRYEWFDRTRMSPDQADRSIKVLIGLGIIEKRVYKFMGDPTTHFRIIPEGFLPLLNHYLANPPSNPHRPVKPTDQPPVVDESQEPPSARHPQPSSVRQAQPLTETTTETTNIARVDKNQQTNDNIMREVTRLQPSNPTQPVVTEGLELPQYNQPPNSDLPDQSSAIGATRPDSAEQYFLDKDKDKPAQQIQPMRTADSQRAATLAAIRGYENKNKTRTKSNHSIDNYLVKIPEGVRELARVFCEYMDRPPLKSEDANWRNGWLDQGKIGLTVDHINSAITYMDKEKLGIKKPQSVTAIAEGYKRNKAKAGFSGAHVVYVGSQAIKG